MIPPAPPEHDAGPISIPGLLEMDEDGEIVFFLSPNFMRQSILRSRALAQQPATIRPPVEGEDGDPLGDQ